MPFNIQNTQSTLAFPFSLSLQRGLISNFSGIHKFGYNSAVGTSFETIWNNGGGFYTYPTTATTAVATSSDTASDNDGTVEIQGLDSNYDLVTETITIGGSASTALFIRVFRTILKTATTGNVNVGTITITVNAIGVSVINPAYGQTLMCVYTVPRNHRAYLMSFDVGCSKQKEIEAKIMARPINGNVFSTKSYVTTFGVPYRQEYLVPEVFNEKSDIEVRAKADATCAVSAGFELYIEKYN
jgi:hypothetical protein